MRLTAETVGIRLSVRLSVSVCQAGSVDSTLPVSTGEVICQSAAVSIHVSGPESGDDPHISVGTTKLPGQRLKHKPVLLFPGQF